MLQDLLLFCLWFTDRRICAHFHLRICVIIELRLFAVLFGHKHGVGGRVVKSIMALITTKKISKDISFHLHLYCVQYVPSRARHHHQGVRSTRQNLGTNIFTTQGNAKETIHTWYRRSHPSVMLGPRYWGSARSFACTSERTLWEEIHLKHLFHKDACEWLTSILGLWITIEAEPNKYGTNLSKIEYGS